VMPSTDKSWTKGKKERVREREKEGGEGRR
jgi:hypothetical protein